MASSPKFVCLFFLLTTLVFSLQTYARDSQFFSKVSRNRDEAPTTTPNTNKFFMNNKENEFEPLNKQQEQEEQQPTFIPQTTETGYGLYGHETGLNPPATTTTTSTKTSLYNMDENNYNKNNFEEFNSYFNNIDDHEDHHEKNYVPELKGLSSASYSTNVAPTKFNNNNYNNDDEQQEGKHYYNNNNDDDEKNNGKYYYNGGAKYNDVQEKQGMSDTRFLENGKYYYDVNGEKTYEPNTNYMSHTNNYNNNNNFETNGYYGNNKKTANRFDAYYDAYNRNNNNKFFGGNSMQGYQNQVPQEEEFAFDDQP